jgi:hypothetical protein
MWTTKSAKIRTPRCKCNFYAPARTSPSLSGYNMYVYTDNYFYIFPFRIFFGFAEYLYIQSNLPYVTFKWNIEIRAQLLSLETDIGTSFFFPPVDDLEPEFEKKYGYI